jgi:RimJ/RimL family protein N-acetyltransferase
MAIPRLETARLILREWQEGDFDAYARLCVDPEVMRSLGGTTLSVLEAWRHMAYLVGHWALRGFGHWAVEEKATGQFVGRLGFQEPQGWPGFEVGWTLAKDRWGRGYATEGATTALEYAFSTLGSARDQPDSPGKSRVDSRRHTTGRNAGRCNDSARQTGRNLRDDA